jgi:hypothetical protein
MHFRPCAGPASLKPGICPSAAVLEKTLYTPLQGNRTLKAACSPVGILGACRCLDMNRAGSLLETPTAEFVRSRIDEFDRGNQPVEHAITHLVTAFPHNTDLSDVLLKVAAINSLYSTQIRGVYRVAERIVECRIDPHLDTGSARLIEAIASVDFDGMKRFNYSFSTKYCSWHRPDLYPIYDSRVDLCLRGYKRQDRFDAFTANDLWNYARFRDVIRRFRDHYQLDAFSLKETDKFLYQQGNDHFFRNDL